MENNPVIILGAGNAGKEALEIFNSNNVVVYGFLDDDKKLHNTEINNILVLGDTDDDGFLKLIGKKCDAFVAVEEHKPRKALIELLHERRKVEVYNAVHAKAHISPDAELSYGNMVSANAVVNTGAKIGSYCIIAVGAIIDKGAKLANYVHVSAGARIGSEAEIEEGAFIGIGAVIVPGVKIGKNAAIGAGSVVVSDVAANTKMFGNPAQKV